MLVCPTALSLSLGQPALTEGHHGLADRSRFKFQSFTYGCLGQLGFLQQQADDPPLRPIQAKADYGKVVGPSGAPADLVH